MIRKVFAGLQTTMQSSGSSPLVNVFSIRLRMFVGQTILSGDMAQAVQPVKQIMPLARRDSE